VLTMLGRPRESARLAATGLEALHRYGLDLTTLVANQVEALAAIGEWDQADRVSAAALRAMTATLPHRPLIMRASIEVGRGDFDAAARCLGRRRRRVGAARARVARRRAVRPEAGLEELLDLTPREAEVLTLLARGCTNREIAAALVISVRTAGVHVSHILRKLGAPNRLEAAAIAHRLSPPRA
jgi:DNA-binding CsgD family transcriptional regulator